MDETNNINSASGFECPNCNQYVKVTIDNLLHGSSLTCPGCLTKFNMDRQVSDEAIKLMQKLDSEKNLNPKT